MNVTVKIPPSHFYSCLLVLLFACSKPVFKERWAKQKAPAHFTARFETSRGNIEAAFNREWSPLAVDRVYAQIRHGFYDHILFYRVNTNFVAQFGADDSVKAKAWRKHKVPDEVVVKGNDRGVISFARSGKDSRSTDLFINLRNNPRLDTIHYGGVTGFPGLGTVTKGMEVADSLYKGYGDKVFQKYDSLFISKTAFLELFPKLDSVKRVRIIRKRK